MFLPHRIWRIDLNLITDLPMRCVDRSDQRNMSSMGFSPASSTLPISIARGTKSQVKIAFGSPALLSLVFFISLLTLSAIAFQSKAPLVFYRFDGTYLLILAAMEKAWALGGLNFGNNPLHGIGGFGLFWHTSWEPGLWLTARLPAWIGPTVAMTFYALLLAVTIYASSLRLGLSSLAAIGAAWIGVLLAYPYVYPPLGFEFLWGVPVNAVYIALCTAAIFLFLRLGRGSWFADSVRFFGAAAICGYALFEIPSFAPVFLIEVGFFGLMSIGAAQTKRERLIKVGAALILIFFLAAIFGRMFYGLWGFTKATFFWYEFWPRPLVLRDLSFFVAWASRWPAWLIYALAVAGALHAAWRGKRRDMRWFGGGLLAFVLVLLAIDSGFGNSWKGPRIAYIDIYAYPFYCVFAAHAAATAFNWLSERFRLPCFSLVGRTLLCCTLPWLVLIDYRPTPLERPNVRAGNPFIWPPGRTPVVDFLAHHIELRPGAPFHGRVASIAGSNFEPQWARVPFISQHDFDAMNLFYSSNDHRMYGLWYYNIPTLLDPNQFSSPFFHLINARLLNAPGAIDTRTYETQSIENDRIMALLGVRYLITDKPLPGRTPVLHYQITQGHDLYIYELEAANVAGYSVTQIHYAASAQDAINLLAESSFDSRTSAVLTAKDVPRLVSVTSSRLTVERGGYRIEASSPSTSLLVLPIEYSACLVGKLTTASTSPPRLMRVNVAMTAVLFEGHVEGRIGLRYGPFSAGCRIEDWREADALQLADARQWPVEEQSDPHNAPEAK
jgi:hypothetical protein